MHLVLPKSRANLDGLYNSPLFFLAGPILGAGDWQQEAALQLYAALPDCVIVSPCRYGEGHPLTRFRMPEAEGAVPFERQIDWERHYLECAAKDAEYGCVLFWLPCQREPREDGQPYARDTYGELGEWRGRLMSNPRLRIVIGAEREFPGLGAIQRNFNLATNREFPVADSLELTLKRALHTALHN